MLYSWKHYLQWIHNLYLSDTSKCIHLVDLPSVFSFAPRSKRHLNIRILLLFWQCVPITFLVLISQRRNNYSIEFQMHIARKSVSFLQNFQIRAKLFSFTSRGAGYCTSTELHLYLAQLRTRLCDFIWQYDGE